MNDLGVIDHFLNVFTAYIDSGFGLLAGDVSFLSATLVALDLSLIGIFWAMGGGGEQVMEKFIRKTLYIGAFAFIITNFNTLSTIIFRSFAGLGLVATGTALTEAELLRPGMLAGVGVDAARPILDQISELAGFPEVFLNIDSVVVLLLAWLVVIISFFGLAVQMFVTLVEFKLTMLAGFVLVPFALWGKTAFLAEKVLGNVVSSGIKVLVLAVIVGIGTGIFADFTTPAADEVAIDHALAVMLASLSLLGLGIFGPGIANGLVSGAPQLGAGAAAGTALAGTGVAAVSAGAAVGAAAIAVPAGRAGAAGYAAFKAGAIQSGSFGAATVMPGMANLARVGADSIASRMRRLVVGQPTSATQSTTPAGPPGWAQRLNQSARQGAMTSVHVARSSDAGSSGLSPKLSQDE